MRRGVRWTSSVVVTGLVLLGSACDGSVQQPSGLSDEPSSTSAAPSSSDGSAPSSASTSVSADEQAVIDQYKGFFTALYDLPSYDETTVKSALEKYATGTALANMVDVTNEQRASGQRPGGQVVFSPVSVTFEPDMAIVRECRDTSSETVVDSSGTTISTGKPNTKIEAHLVESEGKWRVTGFDWVEAGC